VGINDVGEGSVGTSTRRGYFTKDSNKLKCLNIANTSFLLLYIDIIELTICGWNRQRLGIIPRKEDNIDPTE
jgi:hypothetical protein